MSKDKYTAIGNDLAGKYETTLGQLFGKACLKVNGKAFAAFYEDEMVFKLGQAEVSLLKEKYIGSKNWDPSGKKRPMKDWLQIPVEYIDDWESLAIQALNYLRSIS